MAPQLPIYFPPGERITYQPDNYTIWWYIQKGLSLCMEYILKPMYGVHTQAYVWSTYSSLCMEYILKPMYGVHTQAYVWSTYSSLCMEYILKPMYGVHTEDYVWSTY